MSFFKREHKRLARSSYKDLQECYHDTELGLQQASRAGDEKALRKAMENHRAVEYALLYRNTPEFRKTQNKRRKNNGK